MPSVIDTFLILPNLSRTDWRNWLIDNHLNSPGVWVVYYKKDSGQPSLTYDEAVSEALCFGWIDSIPRTLDTLSYRQLFSPRKARSGWSRPNKIRIDQLLTEGLMADAGQAKIDAAKADGSWEKLDDVENGIVPADLQAALDQNATASENFAGFSRSVRRGILEWLTNAKRPQTRAKRIDEIVAKAAQGKKALFDKD
jgi:uncharacterized protein YdeI (YjbR/CyaY-like superfamily)